MVSSVFKCLQKLRSKKESLRRLSADVLLIFIKNKLINGKQ